jgi:dephospho-CoA kinase
MSGPMPFRLGLTGSIGMGKSTVAGFFSERGFPVWDADAVVHRLYDTGGAAVGPVAVDYPEALDGSAISRPRLKALIEANPAILTRIEAIVHPLVAADRRDFVERSCRRGDALVLFDIPLLFETGADADCDATLVVTAPAAVQRARVLSRPGMTEAAFDRILARQMPDAEKRARADYIIESVDPETTRAAVDAVINQLIPNRQTHA